MRSRGKIDAECAKEYLQAHEFHNTLKRICSGKGPLDGLAAAEGHGRTRWNDDVESSASGASKLLARGPWYGRRAAGGALRWRVGLCFAGLL